MDRQKTCTVRLYTLYKMIACIVDSRTFIICAIRCVQTCSEVILNSSMVASISNEEVVGGEAALQWEKSLQSISASGTTAHNRAP